MDENKLPETLKDCLSAGIPSGLLFEGHRGLGMREAAEMVAKRLLNTDRLNSNPDFLLIEPSEKGKINFSDLDPIDNFSLLAAYGSDRKVVIIDHFELLTFAGQSKLLKTIEERSSLVVIAIAYSRHVLETIRTRMISILFSPQTYEAFRQECTSRGIGKRDVSLLYLVTGGCPGVINEAQEHLKVFRGVVDAIQNRRMDILIDVLDFKKHQKNSNFYDTCRLLIPGLLHLMKGCFLELLTLQAGKIALYDLIDDVEAPRRYQRGEIFSSLGELDNMERNLADNYTSDRFFTSLVCLI